MMARSRLLASATGVILALALAVGIASANRITEEIQQIRMVWNRLESQQLTFTSGEMRAICPVTLEGSFFSRTFSKVIFGRIAETTRAQLGSSECTFSGGAERLILLNGTERLPEGRTASNTLPWTIRYSVFFGTLPQITAIRIGFVPMGLVLESFGVKCLYDATEESPAYGRFQRNTTTGEITGYEPEAESTIPLIEGGLCPTTGRFSGRAAVYQAGTTTRITTRLVQ